MSVTEFALRPRLTARAALLLAAVALTACPKPPDPEEPDAGAPPPDVCNTVADALGDPQCELTLGTMHQGFVHPPGDDLKPDQDWYSFRVPANADARTLIHLRGGYAAPNTAVNLSLNLLREDGQLSLARKSDRHGQAAPRPVDIVVPFREANARLLVLVTDDPVNPSRPNFDLRSPYQLTAEVVQDPDANEPNDQTPTTIALASQNGALVGTQTGWLSVTDDEDLFEFDVTGNKVLYLRVSAPQVSPAPAFRLRYELLEPSGKTFAEDVTNNEFAAVNLATARRVNTQGKWRLKIHGHTGADSSEPVPGNLDLQYTVQVSLFDEADPNELTSNNDSLESATALSLGAPGQTASKTGRIGSVADPDWYAVTLAPSNAPTVLHYRVRVSGTPGRFEPLSPIADRELRVLQQVQTGGTVQADRNACLNDRNVCPRPGGLNSFISGLIQEQCNNFSPPRCLWARRDEIEDFEGLRNFEGTLPVPAHAAAVRVFFLMQDEGNNWADDREYTIDFTWRADADEASRISGGAEQPVSASLQQDSEGAYPNPPSNATTLSGTLSYGPGFRRTSTNPNTLVKGLSDYDAVSSDIDQFQISLPMPAEPPLDLAWSLQWEVEHLPDGGTPSDIAIDLEFCDGSNADAGACTPVTKNAGGEDFTLFYTGAKVNAWHNAGATVEQSQPMFDRQDAATRTVVTVRPYGCFCFEPRFVQGGHFKMNVTALDRTDYAPTSYKIRTAWTSYPQSFDADGGTQSCPAPGADAGCWFSR